MESTKQSTYFRQRRVDLAKFDSRWTENAYILVKTLNYGQVTKFSSRLNQILRSEYRVNREIKKLEAAIDGNQAENEAKAMDQLEEKWKTFDELKNDKIRFMIDLCKENFIRGYVYDEEKQAVREASKEDLENFDSELVNELVSAILGNISPKG